jgi:hypothetical protein
MLVEIHKKASEKTCNNSWDLEWKSRAEVTVGQTGGGKFMFIFFLIQLS